MQRAFAVLAGSLLAAWLFLVVTVPLVAVLLMLAAIAWQGHRSRYASVPTATRRVRFLRLNR